MCLDFPDAPPSLAHLNCADHFSFKRFLHFVLLFPDEKNLLSDPLEEMTSEYFSQMKTELAPPHLVKSKQHSPGIVYTAMHGVGARFVDRAFKVIHRKKGLY